MSLSNKCDCYALGADHKGHCNGTKERDVCNCHGDRTLCDFYPDVREKAVKEFEQEDTTKILKDFGVLDKEGKLSEVYRNIYELRKSQLKGGKLSTTWNLDLHEAVINGENITAMHYVCENCGFAILPARITEDYKYCPKCGREIKFDNSEMLI
jgi:predicted Zn-ribbon and HTH transcriptional regulator